MLHTQTINSSTLELLKSLMADEFFDSFCLVGGTAAALQLGHRISVDLDLFTTQNINTEDLVFHLREKYGFTPSFIAKNTVKGDIQGVKIDCISHPYNILEPFVIVDGIRLASLRDISAMKLNAIVNSGERIKDFIDLAWLSSVFSLKEMLEAYERKYNTTSLIPLRAIGYWGDIDFNEPVKMTAGKLEWKKFQKRLEWMIKHIDQKWH